MKSITIDQRWLRYGIWVLIVIAIVAGGVRGSKKLMSRKKEAEKSDSSTSLPSVLVEPVTVRTVAIDLRSQGEVLPLRRTLLSAEVSGRLLAVHPSFEAGETYRAEEAEPLLRIDAADYQAAVESAKSALADSELALQVEQARQAQALRDWGKLGSTEPPNALVKREPQLASAQAKITAARAGLDKAQRDLERTSIGAPYDCRIERTHVDLGAVLAPGMALADLVSLGRVKVRLPLSLEDYGYLQRDERGRVTGAVTATGQMGGELKVWEGVLVRSEEIVDSKTRSIHVVAEFGREGAPAPPIGMFVKAVVAGRSLRDVVEVPRAALVDGEGAEGVKRVLIVDDRERLQFRPVVVKRSGAMVVLISEGLENGERVVVSQMSAPVAELQVEIKKPEDDQTPDGKDKIEEEAKVPARPEQEK